MRAIVQEEIGPAGVLVARAVDDPVPGPGQVQLRVAAAGVHLVDTRLAAGTFAPVTSRFPLADAAGAHGALEERRTEGKVVLVP